MTLKFRWLGVICCEFYSFPNGYIGTYNMYAAKNGNVSVHYAEFSLSPQPYDLSVSTSNPNCPGGSRTNALSFTIRRCTSDPERGITTPHFSLINAFIQDTSIKHFLYTPQKEGPLFTIPSSQFVFGGSSNSFTSPCAPNTVILRSSIAQTPDQYPREIDIFFSF